MRPRYLLAPLLAFALGLSACSTSDGNDGIDAEFFVDTWTLVSFSDGSGDRSDEIDDYLDDIRLTFQSDNDFSILVDYTAALNSAGVEDATITGTYDVSAAEALILTVDDQAASFDVDEESDGEVAISTSAVIMNQLLGNVGLEIPGLTGTVTLTIERT